jgi:hypothetical protein
MNFSPFASALVSCIALCSCSPQWKDEDECIARSLQGVTVERAVNIVAGACRDHFAPKKSLGSETPLSAAELALVTGRAYISPTDGLFNVTLHNGSSRTITRVTVSLPTRSEPESAANLPARTPTRQSYDIEVSIAPRHAELTIAFVMPGLEPSGWALDAALGTSPTAR